MGARADRPAASSVLLEDSFFLADFRQGFPVRRRFFGAFVSIGILLAVAGCALFGRPPTGEELAKDFQIRAKSQKGNAFVWLKSSQKGKGDYDLLITMREGWSNRKNREKRADALTLARTWIRLIQPLKPEVSWVEFVDSKGGVLAWGLYQTEKGLFLRIGKGRSKGENTTAKGSF